MNRPLVRRLHISWYEILMIVYWGSFLISLLIGIRIIFFHQCHDQKENPLTVLEILTAFQIPEQAFSYFGNIYLETDR